jgi:hypothetical protein
MIEMNLVAPKAAAKHELLFNKPASAQGNQGKYSVVATLGDATQMYPTLCVLRHSRWQGDQIGQNFAV